MTKMFCDRCGAELPKGLKSGHVDGIEDADVDGSGPFSDVADLCPSCYRAFRAWLKELAGTRRPPKKVAADA